MPVPLVGANDTQGLHELHIFVGELNPTKERQDAFLEAVAAWNKLYNLGMKGCLLTLRFRPENDVTVLQSSRYIRSNDMDFLIKEADDDAKYFEERGFPVLRKKIEAMAFGIDGVPLTKADAEADPTRYFEFHIKVASAEGNSFEDTLALAKKASVELSAQMGCPVPLSWNNNSHQLDGDNQGHQVYLNVRPRGLGLNDIRPILTKLRTLLSQHGLELVKTISECVWHDTNVAMDHGWIDFAPAELTA